MTENAPAINPMPAYLVAKRDALLRGERVGLTDRDLDALEADGIEIRTLPNPKRLGILDRWIGWIGPETPEEAAAIARVMGK